MQAPRRANSRTVARPTPADAPVMTTTSGFFPLLLLQGNRIVRSQSLVEAVFALAFLGGAVLAVGLAHVAAPGLLFRGIRPIGGGSRLSLRNRLALRGRCRRRVTGRGAA